jgi:hypothetical protein
MVVVARGRSVAAVALAVAAAMLIGGCRRKETPAPPVAAPSIRLNHDKVPLGSPLDITYKFVVSSDARFDEDYRVMLHVVDADEELMWTDDHNPPVPTSQWKPGQTVEYTRTVFVPIYPYIGEASMQIGLYSTKTQKRLPLATEEIGQRAYKIAKLQLLSQTENVFTVFKDGWHPSEVAENNASVEWQWTKKEATLTFRNPKKDAFFYLDADNPGGVFEETQQVQISIAGTVVDQFQILPKHPLLRKLPLTAAQLGTNDMVELVISVDKTFVPALVNASHSKDPRELGIRVFHAFVDAR